ncbi:MAG: sigma factor, subfamily protein [Verrucomicrobiales bacterium]|nr:sigma factor, subfamily protein [Verrucomicrobiales bacterium]
MVKARENGRTRVDQNTSQRSSANVPHLVEHLFRHESTKMVAILTGIFGIEHFGLAEDVVQETLARALQTWPFYGVPENPSAWIMRASRNLALDFVRRQKTFRDKEADIIHSIERQLPDSDQTTMSNQEIADDRLRLMFVCCHPDIPQDAQVALALKTLCGFGVGEISRAFLTTDAATAKRLTRAKQKIRESKIPFEIPDASQLPVRLDSVLQCLYLLFNEGYKASAGDQLVRKDICDEAIRLAESLAQHRSGNHPRTHALLSLMLFNNARTPARMDEQGNLLLLRDQDRSKWDQGQIARAMFHFAQSAAGGELTDYHLQAGIASCHSTAKDYASTDWQQILALYDRLYQLDQSPITALNRAVAVAEVHGPQAALDALKSNPDCSALESFYLYHAVIGDMEARLSNWAIAREHLGKAYELAELKSEKEFLSHRLQAVEQELKNT